MKYCAIIKIHILLINVLTMPNSYISFIRIPIKYNFYSLVFYNICRFLKNIYYMCIARTPGATT